MNRADLLINLASSPLNEVMTQVSRPLTDEPGGFGLVLDSTLRLLGLPRSTWSDDALIDEATEETATVIAEALAYDMVLPLYALYFDQQVDQPLTNLKASQMYLNLAKERNRKWQRAADCGYGPGSLLLFRVTMDYNEAKYGVEY